MLVLSRLRESLQQVLVAPDLHTAILLSPSGQLISFASYPSRRKDDIRVIAGLSGEVWQETQELGSGMVNSELGRIVVLPVDDFENIPQPLPDDYQPLMLLVLNSTDKVEWDELQAKVSCFIADFPNMPAHTGSPGTSTGRSNRASAHKIPRIPAPDAQASTTAVCVCVADEGGRSLIKKTFCSR
ncbi:hypothetical protein HMN09_00898700 [Mycena chlorophos]|uniref:Uncharacterized protein n=1 Tax=Mycena chlorophos TaxID=658473 RepID=A0A8H6W2K0_MYCCL|nr:hypothetical protein HMN09_00898700 [Mycena chlorophos]